MKKITLHELKSVIDARKKASVLDVRTLREYIEFRIEKIPFVPLELLDHIRRPESRLNKSQPVYVISYTEARSKAFCHRLDALGYRTFYVEESGVEAWCRQNLSIIETLKSCRDIDKSALSNINSTGSNPTFNFEIAIMPNTSFGHYFRSILGIAWFFEKMNCNIKFVFDDDFNYFENSTLKVSQESLSENYMALRLHMREFQQYQLWSSSKYAYRVISRLTISKEIQEQADEWVRANLKGNWIGVHFRGTDWVAQRRDTGFIEIDTYVSYLKKVLDKHCNIFVCSDQAQFIDRMSGAFSGRVFFRNIPRSHDNRNLHTHVGYAGCEQRKNALIDLLILSRAGLIYKTGGAFSSLAGFFNPEIKIVSLDDFDSRYRYIFPENFVRIPKAHLLAKQSFLKYYYGKLRARLRNI